MQKRDLYQDIYDVVALIPAGRVTSYGAIAKYLGVAKSSRVVGWAMNASIKNQAEIPAHRVVNRIGMLTGKMHFSTPSRMQEQLEAEGVKIIKDQIQEFEKYYWDPSSEIQL